MLGEQVDDALDRAGRLMLVQAELEVHAHDGEIVAGRGQREIEGARVVFLGRLEEAEDGLRIAKDIGRADETAHRPSHGHARPPRR